MNSPDHPPFLIYGANGYSGALISEKAQQTGLTPTLAGRQEAKIRPLAERLGLPWRVFDLNDAAAVDRCLQGMKLVLHCAGPFSATSEKMVDGCMRARAHYLDITGELSVFEAALSRDEEARRAGIAVMPGVGFDVVPSDCLAVALLRELPDATHLELAFGGTSKASQGTMKSMVEGLSLGSYVRENGKLVAIPSGSRVREIPFDGAPRLGMAIPWGDLVTAFRSTRIPNITVYAQTSKGLVFGAKTIGRFGALLGNSSIQSFLKKQVERRVTGPTESERKKGYARFWGRVRNAAGQQVDGALATPEGYTLTVDAALLCTTRVLSSEPSLAGAYTPAQAFGPELVTSLPGCTMKVPV